MNNILCDKIIRRYRGLTEKDTKFFIDKELLIGGISIEEHDYILTALGWPLPATTPVSSIFKCDNCEGPNIGIHTIQNTIYKGASTDEHYCDECLKKKYPMFYKDVEAKKVI